MDQETFVSLLLNTLTLGMYLNVPYMTRIINTTKELREEWINNDYTMMFKIVSRIWTFVAFVVCILNTVSLGVYMWVITLIDTKKTRAMRQFGLRDNLIVIIYDFDWRWIKEEKRMQAEHIAANFKARTES